MFSSLKTSVYSLIPALLFLLAFQNSCAAQSYSVTVSAGEFDRTESIVSFHLPGTVEPGDYRMTAGNGEDVLLQVDDEHKGWFILDQLSAGESRSYQLEAESESADPGVTHNINSNTITLAAGGSDVIQYFHGVNNPPEELDERYKRGGYIHPAYSPGGVELTNHLNVDRHPHHLGIWWAWTHTKFQGRTPDFWNFHDNTGRVDQADSLEAAWQGPVQAGFRAKHHFVDLSSSAPVVALNEEWEVRVFPGADEGRVHMFDLKSTQTANTAQPLELPEYTYGGMAFRGHADWNDPDNATFLTSEGDGRENGNATRVRWAHLGGHSDGQLAGIAILDHPANFRHPQTVRIHPDIPYFTYAPEQMGDMSIEPGSPYVSRYRFITYDGEPDQDLIDRLWRDFAYPPGVTVSEQ